MLLHASSVVINEKAILLCGPPGIGKSDLALRLIDEGAELLSDDQTLLSLKDNVLMASPPSTIRGLIEVRHVGLMEMPFIESAPVGLLVELASSDEDLERLPDPNVIYYLDQPVLRLVLPAKIPSTPAKIRALITFGLKSITPKDTDKLAIPA